MRNNLTILMFLNIFINFTSFATDLTGLLPFAEKEEGIVRIKNKKLIMETKYGSYYLEPCYSSEESIDIVNKLDNELGNNSIKGFKIKGEQKVDVPSDSNLKNLTLDFKKSTPSTINLIKNEDALLLKIDKDINLEYDIIGPKDRSS